MARAALVLAVILARSVISPAFAFDDRQSIAGAAKDSASGPTPAELVQALTTAGKAAVREARSAENADRKSELQKQARQETVLQVTYDEAAGQTLNETRRDASNPLGGVPTGRSVTATKANVKVSWLAEKGKTTLWSQDMSINPQFVIVQGNATDEQARDSTFKEVQNTLASRPIPYFIPEAGSPLVQLPGSTALKPAN